MKEAEGKHQIEFHNSMALYDSIDMLKVLDRLLQKKLENKNVKILDKEVEKRLEIMKNLLVQTTRIDDLQFQDVNCKDLKLLNENEVHDQICSNIQQKIVNEAVSVRHLPTEDESNPWSDDKNDVSSTVTDEFVSILSEAYKDDPDVQVIPSLTFKNIFAARLFLPDEAKRRNSADEEILEGKIKQCDSQDKSKLLDVKMDCSSSSKNSHERNTKINFKVSQSKKKQGKLSSPCRQKVDYRKLKPEWLKRLFNRTFFEACPEHPIRRNELNKYCIECDASLCQYCVSLASHAKHRLLKIYRHVYKDVVPLDEIGRHINSSQIQPYRCNRQMVIALTPLPHTGTKSHAEAACVTCKRKLIDHDMYSYCSISCKAEAFVKKQNEFAPPFLLLEQVEAVQEEAVQVEAVQVEAAQMEALQVEAMEQNEIQSKTMSSRKRKGIPHRSPLC